MKIYLTLPLVILRIVRHIRISYHVIKQSANLNKK